MDTKSIDWKIVIGVLGWLTSIILFFIKFKTDRKNPQRIVCREISQTSLVRIKKEALEHIAISFQGKPVDRLGYLELDVFNTGNEIIKSASIRFQFDSGTRLLSQTAKVEPNQSQEYKIGFSAVTENVVDVTIPYLNPRKQHKQHILISFICDGDVSDVKVSGGAEGWSVDYQLPIQCRMLNRRDSTLLSFSLSFLFILLVFLMGLIRAFVYGLDEKLSDVIKTTDGVLFICISVVSLIGSVLLPVMAIFARTRTQKWFDHGEGRDYKWISIMRQRKRMKDGANESVGITNKPDDPGPIRVA